MQRTIKKFGGIKTGLRAHNIEHKLWEDITARTQNPLKKLYLRIQTRRLKKIENKIIRDVPFLVPISVIDDLYFSKITLAPRHVIPFGIDINTLPEIKKINGLTDLFYLGALDWIPNQDALQWFMNDVWPAILKEHPDLALNIAGRNAPSDFRNKVLQHQNIVFHGEIADAGKFMRDHSLMIVPLFSGSGLRVKIIEALFNGIPVIASPKAIEGLPVEHEKNILIAANASEYCEIIGNIRSGKINLDQLQLDGRNFVTENFNNLVLAKDLVKFYQSVI